MRDGVKFIGTMMGWAVFCNVLIGELPSNPPAYLIMPFAAFCILGLLWMPSAVVWGIGDANKLARLTLYVWLGTGAAAFILALFLGF